MGPTEPKTESEAMRILQDATRKDYYRLYTSFNPTRRTGTVLIILCAIVLSAPLVIHVIIQLANK
jgi:hypothetical protein